MRLREIFAVLTWIFLIVGRVPWLSAETHSYKAYITAEHVNVRSGPGGGYYATDELTRGEEVEVYWENEDGWFAIRPPSDSFSWIPETSVQREEDGDFATVVEDQVPAQIGSRINNQRSATQVRLHAGESVTILGSAVIGDKTWHKIAPPSGEFRWLRGNTVDVRPLKAKEPPEELLVVPPVPTPTEQDDRVQLTAASVADNEPPSETWTARRGSRDAASRESNQPARRRPEEDEKPTTRTLSALSPGNSSEKVSSVAETPRSPVNSSQSEPPTTNHPEIQELQLDLSRMVANPPPTWKLDLLRARARRIVDESSLSRDRAQARMIIEKIAEFEDIQLRHEQLSGFPVGSGISPTSTTARGSSLDPVATVPMDALASQFDGSGWLMPVISRRRNVPQYALTDDYGRILKFVIPAPGLNLRRYLRKQIGIFGAERMNPTLYRPQLMAERVVVLDRHRR